MHLRGAEVPLLMVFLAHCVGAELSPDGENVCLKPETYVQIIQVSQPKPTSKVWCWSITAGFRCNSPPEKDTGKIIKRVRLVPKCCDGYKEEKWETNKCFPVCLEGCAHGKCVAPQVCSCAPGWTGERCRLPCPEGHFGRSCGERCRCGGGSCDHVTGESAAAAEIVTSTTAAQKHESERSAMETTTTVTAEVTTTPATAEVTTTPATAEVTTTPATAEVTTTTESRPYATTASDVLWKTTPSEEETTTGWSTSDASTVRTTAEAETTTGTADVSVWTTARTTTTDAPVTGTTAREEATTVAETSPPPTPPMETTPTDVSYLKTTTETPADATSATFQTSIDRATESSGTVTEPSEVQTTQSATTPWEPPSGLTTTEPNLINVNGDEEEDAAANEVDNLNSDGKTTPDRGGKELRIHHFIPSLTVLSGVSVLLFLIFGRWLVVRRRRKANKLAIEKEEILFRSKPPRASADGLFWANTCTENPVYLSEVDVNNPTPVLQTFKPAAPEASAAAEGSAAHVR